MAPPRLRSTPPALCAALFCAAPARAQVCLSAFRLDRHVCRPSPVATLTATLTQPAWHGHWFVQSGAITVDGTAYEAVVTNNSTARTTLAYAWAAPGAGGMLARRGPTPFRPRPACSSSTRDP